MQPFEAASAAPAAQDKNYLFDALIAQLHRQPSRWRLIVIMGQPGDPFPFLVASSESNWRGRPAMRLHVASPRHAILNV